jgi:glycosyltransferase involved in cell wall biosynthesis
MITKLSIITINYNDAKGLHRTMESVFKQTFSDLEYIVIDGGSTDESCDVVQGYLNCHSEFYSKFQWISEKDNGIYHAMNKGIVRASGEYCFFLNSGDYLVSSTVLESVFSSDPSENIVFGNLIVCLNDKKIGMIMGKKELTFMDLYRSDVVKHQSAFIKRSLLETFGLYNENLRIVADWEFFLKTIGLANVSYRYVDIDIAVFDNNGLSNNSGSITKEERKQVLENNIAPMLLADYNRFARYVLLEPAFRYKLTALLMRVAAKVAKEYGKILKEK